MGMPFGKNPQRKGGEKKGDLTSWGGDVGRDELYSLHFPYLEEGTLPRLSSVEN